MQNSKYNQNFKNMNRIKKISELLPIYLAGIDQNYKVQKTVIDHKNKKIEGFVKMEKLNK